MSIRFKVILPFLLLTLVVAVTGVYVVTRLVANTLSERLTNQLLEAGRVVSDNFVRQEVKHVETARIIAYTTGLAEALKSGERDTVLTLAEPIAVGLGVENLILITPQGDELVHLVRDANGKLQRVDRNTGAANSTIVQPILKDRNANDPPRRALGQNLINDRYYYYTAIPVPLNGEFAGVIVVGTSLNSILPFLKSTSLADLIVYGQNGQAIGTTLGATDQETLQTVSISEQDFQKIVVAKDIISGKNFSLDGRWYSLAQGPLQVGSDRIGAFAVVLPLSFVIQSGSTSRNTYVLLFTMVMAGVVLIGIAVSRLIINPLYSLVRTSQAIAGGDLKKRTGIQATDEIGVLAHTFDQMTERLQQRTIELEGANHILEQMDRTKGSFIQISAHELRTPLTLIMGYSQMLLQKTNNHPELSTLAKGILDGSSRMTEIVNSMLDVSRIDSNVLHPAKTDLQLDSLVQKIQGSFKLALAERNIKFNTLGLNTLPLVPADPELLHKALYNVIMNAIKFTPDGGSITVEGRVVDDPKNPEVEIAVRDTGIGIDPQSHDLIFNKFYQTGEILLHSSGKTKFKGGGPGLGLAIARGVVQAHGGRIWVESPGHNEHTYPGSTFYIRLPIDLIPVSIP